MMRSTCHSVLARALAVLALAVAFPASGVDPKSLSFDRDVLPVLREYCYDCHADGVEKGGISLDTHASRDVMVQDLALWEAVLNNTVNRIMPPAKKPQPSTEQRDKVAAWIEYNVFQCDCNNPDPGRVTIRRLNREEYNNTVRDLFAIAFRPAEDFPPDDSGYGFDNIGDVLSLSPLLLEKYLAAADDILNHALVIEPPPPPTVVIGVDKLKGGNAGGGARSLPSSGEITAVYEIPADGDYLIRIRAFGDQAGPEPVKMGFKLDGQQLFVADVKATRQSPEAYSHRARLSAGRHEIGGAFLNDYYEPKNRNPRLRGDRNMYVEAVEILGPLDAPPPPPPATHRRIFFVQPQPGREADAARKIIGTFAQRAFRRPLQAGELDRLMTLYQMGAGDGLRFEKSVSFALKAVLVSPHFLFRWELHPEPNNPKAVHQVDEFALASRLSYFLWSSMPDPELMSYAERGQLRANLNGQVQRMLRNTRAKALTDNFAAQWLQIRNLEIATPARQDFPEYDPALKEAMLEETELFFRHIHLQDRSVLDFLNADYTFLNDRLARHYGMPGINGPEFRKVSLKDTQRRGVLTQASVLTITSNPTRTSPVKRGLWVLENILGTPAPPPPPDAPLLEETSAAAATASLRERLEAHRKSAVCASCHARMDPLGFGFENFDAIGQWREKDGKFPIDASGVLVSGESFTNPLELTRILTDEKREEFLRCLTERMLTFALGRGLEFYDKCAVDKIVQRMKANQYKFSSLILGVVESVPFQMRRGETPAQMTQNQASGQP